MTEPRGVALCALAPHPPLLIPQVGGRDLGAVEKTVSAMQRLGAAVRAIAPDVVVIISPHAPLLEDAVAVLGNDPLSGDFTRFGAPEVSYTFQNDLELARKIVDRATEAGIGALVFGSREGRAYGVSDSLDQGVLVPMHFLVNAGVKAPLVAMGMAGLPRQTLYAFGAAAAGAVNDLGRRACVIASGDLSHRLIPGAHAGYDPRAREFDERIVESLRTGDVDGVLSLESSLVRRAGECGYRSLVMALGTLDGRRFEPQVLSYEGPFGVGYAVAVFSPREADADG